VAGANSTGGEGGRTVDRLNGKFLSVGAEGPHQNSGRLCPREGNRCHNNLREGEWGYGRRTKKKPSVGGRVSRGGLGTAKREKKESGG